MSKFNITEALIYENQGLKEEALEIYKKILENNDQIRYDNNA